VTTLVETVGAEELPESPPVSAGQRILRRFWSNRVAVGALAFLVLLVVVAIFAPLIAPHDPNAQNLAQRLKASVGVLGTDDYGRDQLSRLIYGARVSLIAVLVAVGVAAGIGVPLGLLAGFKARWLDATFSRLSDALMSVPALIFALTVIAVLGPGLVNAMVAVGIVTMPRFFRVARAAARDVSQETYIEASRMVGCGTTRLLWRHLLPNVLSPLVVQISVTAGAAVAAEASLSFLGLGVKAPTASWGSMLTTAQTNIYTSPYLVYPPGIMIALAVLAFTLVGDGLRQAIGTRGVQGAEGV
jgi:peptide/nickel transport system permease protein